MYISLFKGMGRKFAHEKQGSYYHITILKLVDFGRDQWFQGKNSFITLDLVIENK